MGSNYFKHDAFGHNCQDYIQTILSANKMGRKDTTAFIMQDVSQFVSEGQSKGLKFITRIAGIAKTIVD
jgi:hypothetical protein